MGRMKTLREKEEKRMLKKTKAPPSLNKKELIEKIFKTKQGEKKK